MRRMTSILTYIHTKEILKSMQFCHLEIFFNHWHKVHFDWYTFYDFIFPGHHTSPYLTQYLLERLLASSKNHNKGRADPSQLDRKALEAHIYSDNPEKTKFVFPETQERIRHYLDEAKELTDVIDFRQPEQIE